MLGFLRTTFAFMVMAYHLLAGTLPLGTYAVFGFYIISGYLMTFIMHENYGYHAVGRKSFAMNRFLRLYPLYWASVIIVIILIATLGQDVVANHHIRMVMPETIESYFYNIFMIFPSWYPNSLNPRLVPPSWALTVEMFFYVLICIGISKTFSRVKIWLALSVCYVLYTFVSGDDWTARYFTFAAGSLPFAIGAAIYFLSKDASVYKNFLRLRLSARLLFILLICNCMGWMVATKMQVGPVAEVGFYLNVMLCMLLVYAIAKGESIVSWGKYWDKLVGDFSYPVYLLHWPGSLVVAYFLFDAPVIHDFSLRGLIFFILSVVFVLFLSIVLKVVLEDPIQKVRNKVRNRVRTQKTEHVK